MAVFGCVKANTHGKTTEKGRKEKAWTRRKSKKRFAAARTKRWSGSSSMTARLRWYRFMRQESCFAVKSAMPCSGTANAKSASSVWFFSVWWQYWCSLVVWRKKAVKNAAEVSWFRRAGLPLPSEASPGNQVRRTAAPQAAALRQKKETAIRAVVNKAAPGVPCGKAHRAPSLHLGISSIQSSWSLIEAVTQINVLQHPVFSILRLAQRLCQNVNKSWTKYESPVNSAELRIFWEITLAKLTKALYNYIWRKLGFRIRLYSKI